MERLEALVDGMIALENDARRRKRALHFGQCFGIIEKVISRLVARNSVDNIVKNPLIFYKHKRVYKLDFAPDTVPATLVYCHEEVRYKWARYFEESHDVIVVLKRIGLPILFRKIASSSRARNRPDICVLRALFPIKSFSRRPCRGGSTADSTRDPPFRCNFPLTFLSNCAT